MIEYKKEISKQIESITNIEAETLEKYIEIPSNEENGDYAFPCFKLAKTMRKAPQQIAEEIKEKIKIEENVFSKIEVVGGYINFFINTKTLTAEVLQ